MAESTKRICTAPDCDKPACARGFCNNHYRIGRKNGTLPKLEKKTPAPCRAEGCDRPRWARGWCPSHYARWRRSGDVRGDEPFEVVDGFGKCTRCQRVQPADRFVAGNTWCRRCVTTYTSNRRAQRKCSECSAPITNGSKSGLCVSCNGISRRSQVVRRFVNPFGYVELTAHRWHPNSKAKGYILEHVLVMSEMLGRPLFPGENVHHKNGVKDDNRPENLELWVTSQPSGQRPDDLVAWAHEILARYGAPSVRAL